MVLSSLKAKGLVGMFFHGCILGNLLKGVYHRLCRTMPEVFSHSVSTGAVLGLFYIDVESRISASFGDHCQGQRLEIITCDLCLLQVTVIVN